MRAFGVALGLAVAVVVSGCSARSDAEPAEPAKPQASTEGAPYALKDTQVWTVPDPVSGRQYEVFVGLPPNYESQPQRRYPVLYVTDADYAFPIIRQLTRRMNLDGPVIEDFILVGLSYSRGDTGKVSRNRDYTPTSSGKAGYGGGPAYQTYLKTQALPFIDARFRSDPKRRALLGHSYGSLLGAQILFTEPGLFRTYILGSPSFWFDGGHMMKMEADFARAHRDLPADVFMYVGGFETPGTHPRNNRETDLVGDMRAMDLTLRSRGYPGLRVVSITLEDEDHLTVAPVGFTRALRAVLPVKP